MNKPRVRFKGYTDDWEQRKLNDIADVRDGTHDSPQYHDKGLALVTSKNLKNGGITNKDVKFISKSPVFYQKYGIIKK